jgi:hypothetical protein
VALGGGPDIIQEGPIAQLAVHTSSSVSCNKNYDHEYQEAMQHLWRDLDLTKTYLESEVMEDIINSAGEDSVKLETVWWTWSRSGGSACT